MKGAISLPKKSVTDGDEELSALAWRPNWLLKRGGEEDIEPTPLGWKVIRWDLRREYNDESLNKRDDEDIEPTPLGWRVIRWDLRREDNDEGTDLD